MTELSRFDENHLLAIEHGLDTVFRYFDFGNVTENCFIHIKYRIVTSQLSCVCFLWHFLSLSGQL